MDLSHLNAHIERKMSFKYFPSFFYYYYALCNTVKTSLWGHLPSRISLWLITSLVSPWEVFYLAFPYLMSYTQTRRGLANGTLEPRRKRLWEFRHKSLPLESFQHPQKEPVLLPLETRCDQHRLSSAVISFLGPKAYFIASHIFLG